jgi:2-polyprenyl-3-methyl-5-hydroxy-6-metoxy-1,4-benzoquinol methylase
MGRADAGFDAVHEDMTDRRGILIGDNHVSEREAWADQAHAQTFDYLHAVPNSILKKHYESFNEGQLLNAFERRITGNRFFEIGCATGELYRYISRYKSRFDYHGFDISEPAIARAKEKYPHAKFHRLTGGFEEILRSYGRPDVVWCRDVVLHQEDPLAFLDDLIQMTKEAVLVRLRTRDVGATLRDSQISCQLHWDKFWVPYIVVNTDELIQRISAHTDVGKVVVGRAYEVLGGFNYRFLPKELYFSESKTAETALFIHKCPRGAAGLAVSFRDRPDRPQYTLGERVYRRLFKAVKTRG